MKIALVGSDGRAHVLAEKLAESKDVSQIVCFPGSHAIGDVCLASNGSNVRTVSGVKVTDAKVIVDMAQLLGSDLVVPGPEACLDAGVGDLCRKFGIPFAGPCRRGARLETSKAYQFQFMKDNGIPQLRGEICETVSSAQAFAAKYWDGVAVKADGQCLGKGVLLCEGELEARAAIDRIMVNREFGRAGDRVVMQELLRGGKEISLHVITDAKSAFLLETFCDYKREGEGDTGENTGGIGGYSPGPALHPETFFRIKERLIRPWQIGCDREKIVYRGILYPGLKLVGEIGFSVLEFNARWGAPDSQILLQRFKGDLAKLHYASATDTLEKSMLSWSDDPSFGVVLCSEGYPRLPKTGREITGLDETAKIPGVKIYHDGTERIGDKWRTTGGRILTVTALGQDARRRVYEAISRIRCEGSWYRRDIGGPPLIIPS